MDVRLPDGSGIDLLAGPTEIGILADDGADPSAEFTPEQILAFQDLVLRVPVADPIVAREIARAQRIIEGQHFEMRRTLWRYSAMVEEQRALVEGYYYRRDSIEKLAETSSRTVAASGPSKLAVTLWDEQFSCVMGSPAAILTLISNI